MSKLKYRVRPLEPKSQPAQSYRVSKLDVGLIYKENLRDLPDGAATDMDGTRFEMGGISPDSNIASLGSSDGIERAFCNHILEQPQQSVPILNRTFKVVGSGSGPYDLYRWNEPTDQWVDEEEVIADVGSVVIKYLAVRSILNILIVCFADGQVSALYWDEDGELFDAVPDMDLIPRDVIYFADRALYIGNRFFPQLLQWSISANPLDLTGAGSGSINLQGSSSEPVDKLIGAAVVGSFAAVFRENSIYRAFRTGSSAIAIGVLPWISEIGTKSQFAITKTSNGVLFIGNDFMPYYLTESGPVSVGSNVQYFLSTAFPETDLHLLDAIYDSQNQLWYIAYPEDGSPSNNRLLIFDFGKYVRREGEIWRRRASSVGTNRLGITTEEMV